MNDQDSDLSPPNHRILIIDDNPAIHEDFRKVLAGTQRALLDAIDADEAALFGHERRQSHHVDFEIDSAFQGAEGLEKARAAAAEGRPYAMAFVDVRMPPGWDGIETIGRIWKECPDIQMVICTAYSDFSWDEITAAIDCTDNVLILKKPFDSVEALQLAHALTRKWQLTQLVRRQVADLDNLVAERTAELRNTNERLKSEIAERKTAEEALRRSEERFSKAFHASPLPMCIQDSASGKLVDVNSRYEALTGFSRAELLEGSGEKPDIWSERSTTARIQREVAAHGTFRDLAAGVCTRRGETRDTLVAAEEFALGNQPHVLLILQDMTERFRIEGQLRQAQKMEAVGQLAAGIAHDLNNLLTVILGNTSLQLGASPLDKALEHSLRQIDRAGERAATLTQQLLAYSRKQIIKRRPLDLNSTVEHAVSMLRRVIGEHIAIETTLAANLPAIHADPTNLDQVIMNLAINARDAIGEAGTLTFRSELREVTTAHLTDQPEGRQGSFVCLVVADTGCGMDPATLERLFEPFFTTKDQGKGTGMGLATVYGIVQQHDGWVEVESAPGRGTTIRIYFPLALNGSVANPTVQPEPVKALPAATAATILVVEDEEMLREYVTTVLQSLGYRVLSAANGPEALAIWAKERSNVELLLTDIVMPNSISGRQLANRLTQERSDLRVIFTSGYSSELIGPEFEEQSDYFFLPKPFLADKLANTVATCLREGPEQRDDSTMAAKR